MRYYSFTQRHSFKANNQDKMMLSTAEKKIILVFISFLIFGVYTMVLVSRSQTLAKIITLQANGRASPDYYGTCCNCNSIL